MQKYSVLLFFFLQTSLKVMKSSFFHKNFLERQRNCIALWIISRMIFIDIAHKVYFGMIEFDLKLLGEE